jgi:hypothetical protein
MQTQNVKKKRTFTSHLKSLNEKQAMTFDDENPGPGFNWTGTKICGWIRSICSTGGGVYCFTSVRPSVRPRYYSSHFSQQLLMAEI